VLARLFGSSLPRLQLLAQRTTYRTLMYTPCMIPHIYDLELSKPYTLYILVYVIQRMCWFSFLRISLGLLFTNSIAGTDDSCLLYPNGLGGPGLLTKRKWTGLPNDQWAG
jgi:hypothetical protein